MQWQARKGLSLKTADMLPDMLTVQQVADYLSVSRNTIYTWVNSGELPSFKTGNTRRIRKETLLEWILAQEQPSTKNRAG